MTWRSDAISFSCGSGSTRNQGFSATQYGAIQRGRAVLILPRQAGSIFSWRNLRQRYFQGSFSWSTQSGRVHSQHNPRAAQSPNRNEPDRVSLRLTEDHRVPPLASPLRWRVARLDRDPYAGVHSLIELRSSVERPEWAASGSTRPFNSFRSRRDSCAAIAGLLSAPRTGMRDELRRRSGRESRHCGVLRTI